jgi:uncharacterized RDD family membrane protein YckC
MGGAQMTSRLAIETPEGVTFSFELATPAVRTLAWSVDAAVLGAGSTVIGKLTGGLTILSPDYAAAIGVATYFFASLAYGIVLEWRWRGQTIGKRLVGLRVIDAAGLHLRFPQIALRNLLRAVDMLPLTYLVGGLTALCNRHAQRLGDIAANTVVVRERKPQPPDLTRLDQAKYNSLLAYPNLAARLRSLTDPEAAALAMRAVALRDHFDPAARVEVFREFAEYFREVVRFPEAAAEGLTDEQYVRSALGAIFQPVVRRAELT